MPAVAHDTPTRVFLAIDSPAFTGTGDRRYRLRGAMQESVVSASRPDASAPPHPPAATLRRLVRGVVLWTTAHAGVLALFLAGYGWPGLVGAAVLWLLGIGPAFVLR